MDREKIAIDGKKLNDAEKLMFDKNTKEQFERLSYPQLWYSFNFGEQSAAIKRGKKGYYIAVKPLETAKKLKEEIEMQSEGLFFKTKEEAFTETCIKWQKLVKLILN